MRQLGFTLTARAQHTRTLADGQVVCAGSAQRSLMLRTGYIEFMEIFNPEAGHMLAAAPRARHGLHVLALGSDDVPAAHARCSAAGLALSPVMDWQRAVDELGAQGLARFRFFGVADWQPEQPSYVCWVQQLTPALLRPPGSTQHANGARGLAGLRYRGAPAAAAQWAQRLQQAGCAALASAEPQAAQAFALGSQRLWVDSANAPAGSSPDSALPQALQLSFAALAPIAQATRQAGLAVHADGAGLRVDMRAQLGLDLCCDVAGA